MAAKLRFYYGTMNSGKSLRVLTTAYEFEQRCIPFMMLKSDIDTRDGATSVKSRIGSGITRECISVGLQDNLIDTILNSKEFNSPKWIIVDEVQFLTEEQIDQLAFFVDVLCIDVMCFGLRTDFMSKLFPGSRRLFEIADKIEEIKSTCRCGCKNIVNVRIDKNGDIVTSGAQTEVGGDDRYITMCRKCYTKKLRDKMLENAILKN